MFIKADLTLTIASQVLELPRKNIAISGVYGLSWGFLSEKEHFGQLVPLKMRLLVPLAPVIHAQSRILSEKTLYSDKMGLGFVLEERQKKMLSGYIEKYGFLTKEYTRKYPRIPLDTNIQTFPVHVLVTPISISKVNQVFFTAPLSFDIANLSPTGVLLKTESHLALSIPPGKHLSLIFEPRGDFPAQIFIKGQVCRVLNDINPENGNLVRYFGVQFIQIDEMNKVIFLELLKDILGKMKSY